MVEQYPYKLFVSEVSESTFNEETGDWIAQNAIWRDFGVCRDEGNGSGRKVVTTDGELYVYFWTIYCPISVEEIKKGSMVRVMDKDGNIRAEKRIVRFSKGQLNCRLWL